jgi:uncharacterized tellurite resistance protein B-like protein
MSKSKLNILVNLATIDNELAGPELKRIHMIAKAHGFDEDDVAEMIRKPEPIKELNVLTEDERFEYLYMVIQLMKIDGQVFKSEIAYCEEIAEKLGYNKKVVADLSKNIYSDPSITADREMLKNKALKHRK